MYGVTQFRTYQACLSATGWQPVEVPSSDGETTYVVLVNPWGNFGENVCHCEGYNFRGKCRHQTEALNKVCGWSELEHQTIVQTDEQRRAKLCPVCGHPTKYEVEVIER